MEQFVLRLFHFKILGSRMFKKANAVTLTLAAQQQLIDKNSCNKKSLMITCLLYFSKMTENNEGVEVENATNGLITCQYKIEDIPTDAFYKSDGMFTAFNIAIGTRSDPITIDFQHGNFVIIGAKF